jgi:ABC-type xylose transport system permease subunit
MRGIQKVAVVAAATVVFVFVGGGSALGRASTGTGGSGCATESAGVQHEQAASSVTCSHEPEAQP